jgi:predicted transcriptional regulator
MGLKVVRLLLISNLLNNESKQINNLRKIISKQINNLRENIKCLSHIGMNLSIQNNFIQNKKVTFALLSLPNLAFVITPLHVINLL